jgi:peptidylprolyl isomerase
MEKPKIDLVDKTPPKDLVVQDITEGDGDEATVGRAVSVHYVGVALSSGKEFDAS